VLRRSGLGGENAQVDFSRRPRDEKDSQSTLEFDFSPAYFTGRG